MEIQHGKGPWAPPVSGIVPLGSTLTLVVAINDYRGNAHNSNKRLITISTNNYIVAAGNGKRGIQNRVWGLVSYCTVSGKKNEDFFAFSVRFSRTSEITFRSQYFVNFDHIFTSTNVVICIAYYNIFI